MATETDKYEKFDMAKIAHCKQKLVRLLLRLFSEFSIDETNGIEDQIFNN